MDSFMVTKPNSFDSDLVRHYVNPDQPAPRMGKLFAISSLHFAHLNGPVQILARKSILKFWRLLALWHILFSSEGSTSDSTLFRKFPQ